MRFTKDNILPDDDYQPHVHTSKLNLFEVIEKYSAPDEDKDKTISTRFNLECWESLLFKIEKHAKKTTTDSKKINWSLVSRCAINLGWRKFEAHEEFKNFVDEYSERSSTSNSAEEKRVFRDKSAGGLLRHDLTDIGYPENVYVTKQTLDWIGRNFSLFKMNRYEVALYFFCIGVYYGVPDKESILMKWESNEIRNIIEICNRHIISRSKEIEMYEYKKSLEDRELFF